MNKRVLAVLTVMIVLSILLVPFPAIAQGDEFLTPYEKNFTLLLASKIVRAENAVAEYRAWMEDNRNRIIGFIAAPKVGITYPGSLMFEGCLFGSNVPDTMSDIAAAWETEVCNEFGTISQKMSSFQDGTDIMEFTIGLVIIGGSLKRIESSLAKIAAMATRRVEDLKIAREAEQEAKKKLDPDDDFCFIATAAYGTSAADEIDKLRRFRDEYLRKSDWGNSFIKFYYEKSPPIARFISRHEILRTVVRECFVEPLVRTIEFAENWWAN